jgi:hypothetical protein
MGACCLIGKIPRVSGQATATRRSLRSRVSLRGCVCGLGGGFDTDSVAERGELGDVVADPAFEVDAAGVVVGSEVAEARGRIGRADAKR